MFVIQISAKTTPEHPKHTLIGEAFISCWIIRDTEKAATEAAIEIIEAGDWKVIEVEEIWQASDEDYAEDDELRCYYEQALIDQEVILYNLSPKYPVCQFRFQITPITADSNASEVVVWVCNEVVLSDDEDPFAEEFWSEEKIESAISLATAEIGENGYAVIQLLDHTPSSREELDSDEWQFYDDAEEDGMCLVFIQESD